MGGINFADEDILRFDGNTWSIYFNGSNVGLNSTDIVALYLVDANTILMSFDKAFRFVDFTADPWDIVQFNATSLGATTAGTFSLYFDGNDVGLDSSIEEIDALDFLPDGRVLGLDEWRPSHSRAQWPCG